MTASELEQLTRTKLEKAGLLPYVVAEKSQFLDLPEGPFLELVVKDGSKLPEFTAIAEELHRADERIDSIVRAVWEVESVDSPLQAYSAETGGPRAAVQYPVNIRSGSATRRAYVEVTLLAGKTFEQHGLDREAIKHVVAEFTRRELRKGGASYWDPVRFPYLEINGDVAGFIVSGALPGLAKKPVI